MAVDMGACLPDRGFRLDVDATDWRGAIRLAGKGLVAAGFTTPDYTDQMIATVESLGPYIVVAPGMALAHARPSAAVIRTGSRRGRPTRPGTVGKQNHEPVCLVIGRAGRDEAEHIAVMSAFASALSDARKTSELADATSPREIRSILGR